MHLFQNARNMNNGRKKQGLYEAQHFVEHLCTGMSFTIYCTAYKPVLSASRNDAKVRIRLSAKIG